MNRCYTLGEGPAWSPSLAWVRDSLRFAGFLGRWGGVAQYLWGRSIVWKGNYLSMWPKGSKSTLNPVHIHRSPVTGQDRPVHPWYESCVSQLHQFCHPQRVTADCEVGGCPVPEAIHSVPVVQLGIRIETTPV